MKDVVFIFIYGIRVVFGVILVIIKFVKKIDKVIINYINNFFWDILIIFLNYLDVVI